MNLQAADTVIIFDTDWNPQVTYKGRSVNILQSSHTNHTVEWRQHFGDLNPTNVDLQLVLEVLGHQQRLAVFKPLWWLGCSGVNILWHGLLDDWATR